MFNTVLLSLIVTSLVLGDNTKIALKGKGIVKHHIFLINVILQKNPMALHILKSFTVTVTLARRSTNKRASREQRTKGITHDYKQSDLTYISSLNFCSFAVQCVVWNLKSMFRE